MRNIENNLHFFSKNFFIPNILFIFVIQTRGITPQNLEIVKNIELTFREMDELTAWFKREQKIVKVFTANGEALHPDQIRYFLSRARYCGDLARNFTCKYAHTGGDGLKGSELITYHAAHELESAAGSFHHSVRINSLT